ncbi:MAG: alpha-glucosidase C-terminal domain-containing protein [Candidatus Promineifilaceae bacterium]
MLIFTHKLIQLRRETAALHQGSYRSLPAPGGVLAYERKAGEQTIWVALNLTGEPHVWELPKGGGETAVHLTTEATPPTVTGNFLPLRPNEGVVLAN